MSINQCLLRYGQCLCDLNSKGCMWLPRISTHLSTLHRTEVSGLSKIPGFTWISWQACSARCYNIFQVMSCRIDQNRPDSQKINTIKVRGSFSPLVGSVSYQLFTEIMVQVLSHNVEKMMWCPIMHEWNVLSLMKKQTHVPRVMVKHSPKNNGYTAAVSLFKTASPKSSSSKMPTQAFVIFMYMWTGTFLHI
jgi:hypothetical protein